MDWERLYDRADYDRCVYLAGESMPDMAARFLEARGQTEEFASVGCGPAVTLFSLAERFPDVDFAGYDLSPTVIRDDRALAAEEGLDDVAFEVAELPELDGVDRRFDVVYCVAVLFFVADVERALRSLYDRVRPGGHLVVTIPTEDLRAHVRSEFEGRKREAFSLVEDGENLLTVADVEAALGAPTESYWDVVGANADQVTPAERERWTTLVVEKNE